jgi:hypothetical protein
VVAGGQALINRTPLRVAFIETTDDNGAAEPNESSLGREKKAGDNGAASEVEVGSCTCANCTAFC